MKKIVTHTNPDLDAVTSVWLIKRFLPGWEKAEVKFVTADQENKDGADELWVDIGGGELDHHQTSDYLSAARLTWEFTQEQRRGREPGELESAAVEEIVEVVTQVDNAHDLYWPEVDKARYYFQLHTLIDGLRGKAESDEEVIGFGSRALDAVLWQIKNKIKAEKELAAGQRFETPWGKAVAVKTGNRQVLWAGEVVGFVLVARQDPETGAMRIYARPDSTVDLTKAYNRLKEADPRGDWFLHASKRLLLNQSSVNPRMRPTKLDITKLIQILKES